MSMNKIKYLFLFIVLSHLFYVENGFYVPGVAPKEFLLNDIIDVRVFFFLILIYKKKFCLGY